MLNELDYMKESVYDLCFIYKENRSIVSVLDILLEDVKEVITLPASEYNKKDIKTLVENNKCFLVELIDDFDTNDLKISFKSSSMVVNMFPSLIKKEVMRKNLPVILLVKDVDFDVFLKEYYYISLNRLNNLLYKIPSDIYKKENRMAGIFTGKLNREKAEFIIHDLREETLYLLNELEILNKVRYDNHYIDQLLLENRIEDLKIYMSNK